MADKLTYKGGTTVVGSTGGIQLVPPKAGSFHKFPRWWNKKGGQYIDVAIFKVTLDSGVVVRLVIPASDRMTLEIRHDGFGNFTFPIARVDRIAVVEENGTTLYTEYQFSKISGGSVLKRTVNALPSPAPAPEPTPEPTPEPVQVIVEPPPMPTPEPELDEIPFNKMTKTQLLEYGEANGLDFDGLTKAQILDQLS